MYMYACLHYCNQCSYVRQDQKKGNNFSDGFVFLLLCLFSVSARVQGRKKREKKVSIISILFPLYARTRRAGRRGGKSCERGFDVMGNAITLE